MYPIVRELARALRNRPDLLREIAHAWLDIAAGTRSGSQLQLDAILSLYDRAGLEPPSRLRQAEPVAQATATTIIVVEPPPQQ
jgi:hypothetical protein